jgi:CheY-like chemotaxis protein
MPEMDGFEATRRIKAAPATKDIPVIIISGNDDEPFVQEARSAGALDAIAKPPAAGVLETLLRSIPETVAGQAPSAAVAAAPQPVAVERRATPHMDQAAVHALVERMLSDLIEHLHGDLLAELRTQMEAELGNERKAWQEQFDQTAMGMADLRHDRVEAETLRQQLHAMEQRLLPL